MLAQGVEVLFDLPIQGCLGNLAQERAGDVLLALNGTRAIFRVPHQPGGVIDESSGLYFSWTEIKEQGRRHERCAPITNDVIYAMQLKDCQCNFSRFHREESGVSTAG